MGGGRWDSATWNDYATRSYGSADRATLRTSKATAFTAATLDTDLDPKMAKLGMRESRDSDDNPASTAIIVMTDVTGSMGHLAKEVLVGMETVCSELYDRKPVTDPHILTGAIGDAFYDSAPLQISQFEADIRIVDQVRKLYVEGGGGGNFGESYAMAWLFAARMTSIDCWEKRGQKGFLVTVGDEPLLGAAGLASGKFHHCAYPNVAVTKEQAKAFLGIDLERDLSAEEIYDEVSQRWEVIHICVGQRIGDWEDDTVDPADRKRSVRYHYKEGVEESFGKVLGDRLLWLQDVEALPELIVSTIQVLSGHDKDAVASSWSGGTAVAVADALKGVVATTGGAASGGGAVQRI